jgi:phosphoribosylglycinamide formyltransferase-1
MKKIAIFASGSGSNAQRITEYFSNHSSIRVILILTNNPKAFVIERARKLGVELVVFTRDEFYQTDTIVDILRGKEIDLVVLAGFLWLIPDNLLHTYEGRILNIHPALLPKYGGKGMYGMRVHEAVIAAGEEESGITIHLVNEKYDEGLTLFQTRCKIESGDTPEVLAAKIHELEHRYFPEVVEKMMMGNRQ